MEEHRKPSMESIYPTPTSHSQSKTENDNRSRNVVVAGTSEIKTDEDQTTTTDRNDKGGRHGRGFGRGVYNSGGGNQA